MSAVIVACTRLMPRQASRIRISLREALADALPLLSRVDGDLPDEQRIVVFRRAVTRDPANAVVIRLGDGAGICEMSALQQIAVERVVIERTDIADQPIDCHAIGFGRTPELDRLCLGSGIAVDGGREIAGRDITEQHKVETEPCYLDRRNNKG